MALRATIGADFSEFRTALKSVEVKLKTTSDVAKNVGRDLSKMVEGFSGTNLFRQAELTAEAVTRIGGAAKLTEAEQRKVNRTVEEAIAKYRALGQEAPAHLQKLAGETKQVAAATESWTAGVGKMAAGYLAGMASFATVQRLIGGAVDFLKESVQAAAEAEAAQTRLATAMKQNGVATEGNRAAFQALAEEMQRTTVYEDDQIVALEAMATQLGVLPSQMDGAIKAAANLASGLGIDLEQAMKMIVKANNESFTAFQKLGISIDEARAKAEGLPYVLAQINEGMGGQAAAEIETYAGRVKQLANEWGDLKEQLGGLIISNGLFADSLRLITDALRGVNAATETWSNTLSLLAAMGLRGGLPALLEELRRIGQIPPPKLDPKGVTDGAMAMRQALDGVNESLDKLLKKAKDQAAKDLEAAGRSAKKAGDDFKRLQADIYELEKVGAGATLEVWKFGRVLDEAGDTADTVKGLDDVAKKLYEIEKIGAGAATEVWKFGQVIDEAGDAAEAAKKAGEVAAGSWSAGFQKVAAGFPNLMVDAITNGNWRNAIAAMGSQVGELIGSQVGKSLGKAIGGAFGSVLSAVMPGVGSLLGPVIDKFWGWATKAEGRKVNDLRDAFISAAGGLAALNAKAAAAGTTLNALLRASTVKDYEAAVAALNTKLERTAQLQGELAGLQQQLADRQVMDWQRAQELIEKYGGTLGNLGQAFTDAKTAANWKSIWDDWQTLIDMGADVGGVLVSMKDEISALVQESIRVGTEIPAQFKPLIEELIRTGQLLDANGEAITDIGQLKFGAPLVSEVDKIIAKIDALIQALTTGLVGAFESVGRVRLPTVKIPYEFEATNELPEGGRPTPSFASGSGGFRNFGAGTLAMLHGYEAVVPRGEAVTSGRPIELTLTLTSTTNLDGKEVARNQVRYLPNQLALAGV